MIRLEESPNTAPKEVSTSRRCRKQTSGCSVERNELRWRRASSTTNAQRHVESDNERISHCARDRRRPGGADAPLRGPWEHLPADSRFGLTYRRLQSGQSGERGSGCARRGDAQRPRRQIGQALPREPATCPRRSGSRVGLQSERAAEPRPKLRRRSGGDQAPGSHGARASSVERMGLLCQTARRQEKGGFNRRDSRRCSSASSSEGRRGMTAALGLPRRTLKSKLLRVMLSIVAPLTIATLACVTWVHYQASLRDGA